LKFVERASFSGIVEKCFFICHEKLCVKAAEIKQSFANPFLPS